MIKILKPGNEYYIAKCNKCGCKFTYTYDDILLFAHVHCVYCPQCGGTHFHVYSKKKKKKNKERYKEKEQ